VVVDNSGNIATSGDSAHGIFVMSEGGDGIGGAGGAGGSGSGGNGGNGGGAGGAGTGGDGGAGGDGKGGAAGDVSVTNRGSIATSGDGSDGIRVITIAGTGVGGTGGAGGTGTGGSGGSDGVGGSGPAGESVSGLDGAAGLGVDGDGGAITIENYGSIATSGDGVHAEAIGPVGSNPILINNSGFLNGGTKGVFASSPTGTTINNSGFLSANSLFAIDTVGASTTIVNSGTILGFVDLTDEGDTFTNQKGGAFEARKISDFGAGFDLFTNRGTVHAAGDPSAKEFTAFINLEEFINAGLISMVDGRAGDVFLIDPSDPVEFIALSGSKLAVDAELGAPGSKSDILEIDGNVTGKTAVIVNDTGHGGAFNKAGIPVVKVAGSVGPKDFFLKGGPIDAGFFTYDLFFDPGSPNVFLLKSALGQSAFVLPQLLTGMQDLWHTTSSTWFDRTADLRMALYGGDAAALTQAPPSYLVAPSNSYPGAGYRTIYPGLWARGSLANLSQEDSVNFKSFGPATAHLNRDQRTGDFEGGFDFGKRDLFTPGDALIFGVLGGFVLSELDYHQLAQSFDFTGGQAGAYATYLNGGLFVDTLLKADILKLDPKNAAGFGDSLDAHNIGVRVDSGYRFGGFRPGLFFEPLATISVVDSEIDSFTANSNRVSFDDGTSVRGRLGLRIGTNIRAGEMTVEPFVIGSVWHEFEDSNQSRLISSGTLFNLTDNLEGTWGEVSAGANLVNIGMGASGFAKVDVTLGDNVDGVGGQVGVRYKW
jgi:hypothetical protein